MHDETPDFAGVEKETGTTTGTALRKVWNYFRAFERIVTSAIRRATDYVEPRILALAPAAAQHDLGLADSTVVHFTGATAFDLTGFKAPGASQHSRWVVVFVTGAGTVTLKHQNAGSLEKNRLVTTTAGDVALATGGSAWFVYLADRYRQVT